MLKFSSAAIGMYVAMAANAHRAEMVCIIVLLTWRNVVNLEERGEGSPHHINVSVHLSVRLSVKLCGIPKQVDLERRN